MPFTFLSHQAPVLPLKIAAPRWFDGTALVIGSMVPDLVFFTHGTSWYVDGHTVAAQLWFCLPITLVLTFVFKRAVAGPLAAHLPAGGSFRLHEYGRLASWRSPTGATGWLILVASALLGAFTHLVLDSFTHGFGWVVQRVDALHAEAFVLPSSLSGRVVYVHDMLQLGGTVVGTVITVWCLHIIGKRRLLECWYPTASLLQPTAHSRHLLVGWTAVGSVLGMLLALMTVRIGGIQDLIIRIAECTLAGVLVGCLIARRSMVATSDPDQAIAD